MGWTWRRSTSFGPFRFNFSGSGVGVSVGVRGARISSGPRGTYVHLVAGGFRYSQRIDHAGTPARPGPTTRPAAASGGPARSVENVEPAGIVESTPDDLLDEIRRKRGRVSLAALTGGLAAAVFLLFLLALAAEWPAPARWVTLAVALGGLAAVPWASWWDRRAGTVHVRYVLDPLGEKVQEGIERLLAAFSRAHGVWSVQSEHHHGDWKRNAGAGVSVGRRPVRVGWGAPSLMKTNVRVGFLDVDGNRLYFFPDRLLVFGRGGVRGVPYSELRMQAGHIQFIEEGAVPRDARVLGRTWRYVNKDGGPDRRFANNYQIPVVMYGTLEFSSPSGLRMSLQTSTDALATGAAELLALIQAAVHDLHARKALAPLPASHPHFEEHPPPLVLPGLRLVRSGLDVLSFRWMSNLPEWAVPIAWGMVFSLPVVALLARFTGAAGAGGDLFLCCSFVVTGGGGGRLLYEWLSARHSRLQEEAAARRSRFRALLLSELRHRPSDGFSFPALVEIDGLPRAEADVVADDLFRRIADQVVKDGVVTKSERAKLGALAKSLDMDPHRADRITSEASSERYRMAVAEAMSDGTVTEEEARALNELRANLCVRDSRWVAGDVVS
jgi:hypothetical protein